MIRARTHATGLGSVSLPALLPALLTPIAETTSPEMAGRVW
jgi:hypothetical protein